jgi:hypothetical protein
MRNGNDNHDNVANDRLSAVGCWCSGIATSDVVYEIEKAREK